MAMKPKTSDAPTEIEILSISQGEIQFAVVGVTPILFNRMSEKAKRELLLPKGRKSAAEKAVSMKHDPIQEFRDSVYRNYGSEETLLAFPAPGFKGAMSTAALRLPGATKTEIGQLSWVPTQRIAIYGIPKLHMGVVRSADMNKTPDIRTRAIVDKWAAIVTVRFVQPNLTGKAVANLMAAAGIISGIGDFRQEKLKGSHGQFRLTTPDDPEFKNIIATGGKAAQEAAMEAAEPYDGETEELLSWYMSEIVTRGREGQTTTNKRAPKSGENGSIALQ